MQDENTPFIIKQAIDYHSFRSMSRSHPLSFFKKKGCGFFIKREDELSFGISGSKLRKYLSLINSLKIAPFKKIGVIGSAFSNNIISISQLLIENKLPFHLFLLKPNTATTISSNSFLLGLLNPPITWINRSDWEQVKLIASKTCDIILPEGCFNKECLTSAMTLGLDILKNESELNLSFDHIIVDSGSGFTSISLLLFFHLLKIKKQIHIISLADSNDLFQKKLDEVASWIGLDCPKIPYQFYSPSTARSFGSTNQTITRFIELFAQKEGVFLDPIYSAKTFYTFEQDVLKTIEKGNCLVIHSGGGLSLFGFKDFFNPLIIN